MTVSVHSGTCPLCGGNDPTCRLCAGDGKEFDWFDCTQCGEPVPASKVASEQCDTCDTKDYDDYADEVRATYMRGVMGES